MAKFYDSLDPKGYHNTWIRVTFSYPHERGTDNNNCMYWFPSLEKALEYLNNEVTNKEKFDIMLGRRLVLLPSGEDVFPLLKTMGFK